MYEPLTPPLPLRGRPLCTGLMTTTELTPHLPSLPSPLTSLTLTCTSSPLCLCQLLRYSALRASCCVADPFVAVPWLTTLTDPDLLSCCTQRGSFYAEVAELPGLRDLTQEGTSHLRGKRGGGGGGGWYKRTGEPK
jgi:hypothetical protein